MSSRTRRKSAPFPLSPMKATLRPGAVGIGPGAPCACPCAGPRARARRVARIRPTTRRSLLIAERLDRVEAGRLPRRGEPDDVSCRDACNVEQRKHVRVKGLTAEGLH